MQSGTYAADEALSVTRVIGDILGQSEGTTLYARAFYRAFQSPELSLVSPAAKFNAAGCHR